MKVGSKSRGGSTPQKQGKSVEREIAALVGGNRIPMSGAIKRGPYNLTGDIAVKDAAGREYMKIESKMTGAINPKGESIYTLNEKVLRQMYEEAQATGELGALWIHWKHKAYNRDYVILVADDFMKLLEDAKVGAAARRSQKEKNP